MTISSPPSRLNVAHEVRPSEACRRRKLVFGDASESMQAEIFLGPCRLRVGAND